MALLDYEEGLWARAEASLMVPPGFPFTMHFEALCEGGAVDFVFTGASYAESERQQLTIYRGNRPEEVALPRTDAYQAEIDEFLACISEGRAPVSGTAAEARQALVLALGRQRVIGDRSNRRSSWLNWRGSSPAMRRHDAREGGSGW